MKKILKKLLKINGFAFISAFVILATTSFATADSDNIRKNGSIEVELPIVESKPDITSMLPQQLVSLPEKYSSVDKGVITDVKDQGNWGTCWTFSSINGAEASILSKNYSGITKDNLDLSELHLSYFMYNTKLDPLGGLAGDSNSLYNSNVNAYLNDGGNTYFSALTAMGWSGQVDEMSEHPYYAYSDPLFKYYCDNLNDNDATDLQYNQDSVHLKSFILLDTSDIQGIKESVVNNGAACISYYEDSSNLNDLMYYYESESPRSNHAVSIVGWDDTISADKFLSRTGAKPSGNGAWLIKNSWGNYDRDGGYFWLSYYDTSLYNAVTVDYVADVDDDFYDNNYQYDGSVQDNYLTYYDKNIYSSNVFTSQQNEKLEAVAAFFANTNANYTVKVYKNLTDTTIPTSGTLVATESGSVENSGYYTIDLSSSVSLHKGDTFSVVLCTTVSNDYAYASFEYSANSWYVCKATCKAGQSFISNNESDWIDVSTQDFGLGNVRIKAFTKNSTESSEDVEITSSDVTLSTTSTTYTGSEIKPTVTVVSGGEILVNGTDYFVNYINNKNVGTASVTIEGVGNYTGIVTKTFAITQKSVSTLTATIDASSYTYTGSQIKPTVTISGLVRNVDFTVSYANNVKVGTATITINGIGNFTGTKTITFAISKGSIADLQIYIEKMQFAYTGTAIKPKFTIYGLTENVDFKVTYTNNVNVGTANVKIVGINDYIGEINSYFYIVAPTITDNMINFKNGSYYYTGSAITPTATITGYTLNKDYTVSYQNNTNVGTAYAVITGINNLAGYSVKLSFSIVDTPVSRLYISLSATSYTYTGNAIKPKVTISGLTLNKDYTLAYANNIKAGTGTVTITGIGNYTGTVTKTFSIKGKSISAMTAGLSKTSYTYSGAAKKPTVSISGLTNGVDFTVGYTNNIVAGTAKVTITGKGNYSGTISKTFTIKRASNPYTLSCTQKSFGTALSPKTSGLKESAKITYYYKVYGASNSTYTTKKPTKVGKYTVKAVSAKTTNYNATTKTCTTYIVKKSVSGLKISLSSTKYTYSGTQKKPKITVKYGTKTLVLGTNYTVAYSSNIKAGTGKVTIKGKGNYTGTITKTFTISKRSLTSLTGALSTKTYTYNGNAKTPSVKMKIGTYTLVKNKDFTLTYSNNKNTGKGKVTIKGIGSCTGTKVLYFKIKPKAPTISSATSKTTKTATITWKKDTRASGYQVVMATSSSGKYSSIKTVTKNATVSYKKTGLTKGKTYYFKVRSYKTIDGVKVYGAYSKVKSIRVS